MTPAEMENSTNFTAIQRLCAFVSFGSSYSLMMICLPAKNIIPFNFIPR